MIPIQEEVIQEPPKPIERKVQKPAVPAPPVVPQSEPATFDAREPQAKPADGGMAEEAGAEGGGVDGQIVFQGAYVYTLDLQNGFQLKGRITHYEADDDIFARQPYYWYGDEKSIQRIVRIGDFLYTISQAKVKATDRNNMQDANTVTLEGGSEPVPVPFYE